MFGKKASDFNAFSEFFFYKNDSSFLVNRNFALKWYLAELWQMVLRLLLKICAQMYLKEKEFLHITTVTIFGVRVVESQWGVLLLTKKIISRRNFWVKQAASAEVIYNDAVHTQRSTADSKENPTQRYYLS